MSNVWQSVLVITTQQFCDDLQSVISGYLIIGTISLFYSHFVAFEVLNVLCSDSAYVKRQLVINIYGSTLWRQDWRFSKKIAKIDSSNPPKVK